MDINPDELREELEEETTKNKEDIEKQKERVKRDTRLLIILLIIFLIVILFTIGMGLALKQAYDNSTGKVPLEVVKSEILEVKYTETDFFNITDNRILSDKAGLTTKPLKFNLTNTGTSRLKYDVKLIPLNANSEKEENIEKIIPSSSIKYKIVENSRNSGIKTFSEAEKNSLYSGKIDAKESIDYDLYIWLDDNSNVNLYNKTYIFKIQIEAGKSIK